MFVRAPILIQFTSPRTTVLNQRPELFPMETSPITKAPGATKTSSASCGCRPSYPISGDIKSPSEKSARPIGKQVAHARRSSGHEVLVDFIGKPEKGAHDEHGKNQRPALQPKASGEGPGQKNSEHRVFEEVDPLVVGNGLDRTRGKEKNEAGITEYGDPMDDSRSHGGVLHLILAEIVR